MNSYFHNTMIRAYFDSPDPFHSISVFLHWHNSQDPFSPSRDQFTYPFVLKAFSKLKQKSFGKHLHEMVYKSRFEFDEPDPESFIQTTNQIWRRNNRVSSRSDEAGSTNKIWRS
ncbi:hypothetical protein Hdeb2414_s0018g00527821 [Helianthus debilis subsp. tardiflorus]